MDEEKNLVDREETADAPLEDDQVLHHLHLSKNVPFCCCWHFQFFLHSASLWKKILLAFNQQWRMFWFCSFSQISSPLLSICKNFQIRMGAFHKLIVYFWKLLGPKPISGPNTRQFTIAWDWTGLLFKTNATSVLFLAVQTRVWDSSIPTPVTHYRHTRGFTFWHTEWP